MFKGRVDKVWKVVAIIMCGPAWKLEVVSGYSPPSHDGDARGGGGPPAL